LPLLIPGIFLDLKLLLLLLDSLPIHRRAFDDEEQEAALGDKGTDNRKK
jgi:hypothetical protein